ncbi:MAG TPA: hypothetical protein VF473_09440 [Cyclobacteriaceae bacterium]
MRVLIPLFLVASATLSEAQNKINRFGEPINHPSMNTSSPYMSLEGNSMLFVSDNAEDNVLTVFYSAKPDGVNWKEPVPLPKTLNGRLNFLRGFGLSPDGKRVYISTTKGGGLGGYDIYLADMKGTYWAEPMNIGLPINSKENEGCASIATDGNTMYFMRCTKMDAGSASGCRIMVATKKTGDIRWQSPVELPPSINTGNSQAPRIMGDGQTLIFSSDKMGGKGGMDLFITKKTGNDWSKPVPLDFANTAGDDEFVSANSLGRYLVKDSPAKSVTEIVEVLFPTELKPRAVMKVEGKVQGPANPASPYVNLLDAKTQQRLLTTRPSKEGAFTLYLIEGNIYNVVIDPEEDNYTFFKKTFDLTGEKISTLEKLDATLKSLAPGDVINLDGVQFKPNSSEMTESSKTELRKAARLINGAKSLKFDLEVRLYGYRKDSIQSDPDLTEMISDTTRMDSLFTVKNTYHNDRTQQESLEVVNYLIEQGVSAERIKPSTRVFDAVPEERKTIVQLIARQP